MPMPQKCPILSSFLCVWNFVESLLILNLPRASGCTAYLFLGEFWKAILRFVSPLESKETGETHWQRHGTPVGLTTDHPGDPAFLFVRIWCRTFQSHLIGDGSALPSMLRTVSFYSQLHDSKSYSVPGGWVMEWYFVIFNYDSTSQWDIIASRDKGAIIKHSL